MVNVETLKIKPQTANRKPQNKPQTANINMRFANDQIVIPNAVGADLFEQPEPMLQVCVAVVLR